MKSSLSLDQQHGLHQFQQQQQHQQSLNPFSPAASKRVQLDQYQSYHPAEKAQQDRLLITSPSPSPTKSGNLPQLHSRASSPAEQQAFTLKATAADLATPMPVTRHRSEIAIATLAQQQQFAMESPSVKGNPFAQQNYNFQEQMMPASSNNGEDLPLPKKVHSMQVNPMHHFSVPRLSEPLRQDKRLNQSPQESLDITMSQQPHRKSLNHILIQGDNYTGLQQSMASRNLLFGRNTVASGTILNTLTTAPSSGPKFNNYINKSGVSQLEQKNLNRMHLPPLQQPSSPMNNPFESKKLSVLEPMSALTSHVAGTTMVTTPANTRERTSTIIQESPSGSKVKMNFTQFVDNFEPQVSRNATTTSMMQFNKNYLDSEVVVNATNQVQPPASTIAVGQKNCLTQMNGERKEKRVEIETQTEDCLIGDLGILSEDEKNMQQKLFQQLGEQIFEIHRIFEQFNSMSLSTFKSGQREKRVFQEGVKTSINQQCLLDDLKQLHSDISIWARAHVQELTQNIQSLSQRMTNLRQIHSDNNHKIQAYEVQIQQLKKELKQANVQLKQKQNQLPTIQETQPKSILSRAAPQFTPIKNQLDDVVQEFAEQVQTQMDKMNNSHARISGVSLDPTLEFQGMKTDDQDQVPFEQPQESNREPPATAIQPSKPTSNDLKSHIEQVQSQQEASPKLEQKQETIVQPVENQLIETVNENPDQHSQPLIDLKPIEDNKQNDQPQIVTEEVCNGPPEPTDNKQEILKPVEVKLDQIAEVPMDLLIKSQTQSPPEFKCQDVGETIIPDDQQNGDSNIKSNQVFEPIQEIKEEQIAEEKEPAIQQYEPEITHNEEFAITKNTVEAKKEQQLTSVPQMEEIIEQLPMPESKGDQVQENIEEIQEEKQMENIPENKAQVVKENDQEFKTDIKDSPVTPVFDKNAEPQTQQLNTDPQTVEPYAEKQGEPATEKPAEQATEKPAEPPTENKPEPQAETQAQPEQTDEEKRAALQEKLGALLRNLKKSIDKENAAKRDQNVKDAQAKVHDNMNAGNLQNLIGNKIKNIMKAKNEAILESMKAANNEEDKMKLWDQHMAQKRLDERKPVNTLHIKLSDYFKGICKGWEDDLKQSDLKDKQRKMQEEEEQALKAQQNAKKKRTVVDIVQTPQYEQQIKKLNSEYTCAKINKEVDVNNVIADNIIQNVQLNDRKKQREKFMIMLKEKYHQK